MRTTLTLEPDVAVKLEKKMADENVTLKQAVNDALRRGLDDRSAAGKPKKRFRVEPWPGGLKAGIDYDKTGQVFDDLDADAFAAKPGK